MLYLQIDNSKGFSKVTMGKSFKDYDDYQSSNRLGYDDSEENERFVANRKSNLKKKNHRADRNIKARRNEYGDLE